MGMRAQNSICCGGPPDCNGCNPVQTENPNLPWDVLVTPDGTFSHGLPNEGYCSVPSTACMPQGLSGAIYFECGNWHLLPQYYIDLGGTCGEPYMSGIYEQYFRSRPFGRVAGEHIYRRSISNGDKCTWGLSDWFYADTVGNSSWYGNTVIYTLPTAGITQGHASIKSMQVYNPIITDPMDYASYKYPGPDPAVWDAIYKDMILARFAQWNSSHSRYTIYDWKCGYNSTIFGSAGNVRQSGGKWHITVTLSVARSIVYHATRLRPASEAGQVMYGNPAGDWDTISSAYYTGQPQTPGNGCYIPTEEVYKKLPTNPSSCPPSHCLLVDTQPGQPPYVWQANPTQVNLTYTSIEPANCQAQLFNPADENDPIHFVLESPVAHYLNAWVACFGLSFPSTITARFLKNI